MGTKGDLGGVRAYGLSSTIHALRAFNDQLGIP
jgi:hypothetical protein